MNAFLPPPLLTTADLLALPDDVRERWLIAGKLREGPVTIRNRFHSKVLALICHYLVAWNQKQSLPRGEIVAGEAGIILSHNPESTVGVDVAYVSPEVSSRQVGNTTLIDGPPVLAVEILSPSDTQEAIHEKIQEYLTAGVKLVWIVDPDFQTVIVHSSGVAPLMFNNEEQLQADPHLAGFSVPVAALFA